MKKKGPGYRVTSPVRQLKALPFTPARITAATDHAVCRYLREHASATFYDALANQWRLAEVMGAMRAVRM